MQVVLEMHVGLVEEHELINVEGLGLVQGLEGDLRRGIGRVDEWRGQCVQVMNPNCHQRSLPADIVMELLLELD